MNRIVIIGFLTLTVFSSCNRKVGAIFGKKNDRLEVVNPEFDYLSAKAKFKFDNEENKVSATANFRIKKDSIIWISITPGLGIEAARVLIDTENVFVLDRINKQYYEYTFQQLSDQYDFDFNFGMIQSVILGNLIEPYRKQKVQRQSDYFVYNSVTGPYVFENFIGATSMKLERVKVIDEETRNAISVTYSNFILVDSQVFPNEIFALIDYESEKKSNTEISISYNKMEIEKESISFPYSVPSKYEKK